MGSLKRYGVYKDWEMYEVCREEEGKASGFFSKIDKKRELPPTSHLKVPDSHSNNSHSIR